MESLETIIARAALAMDLAEDDLRAIFGQGAQQTYEAGDWLFHESTPRDWAGIIQDGELEIMRGLHGSTTMLARLGPGAMLAEGALLDDTPHTTGAFTRYGVVVWQVPRAAWGAARQTSPAVFYRVVARVAEGISMRLPYASEQLPAPGAQPPRPARRCFPGGGRASPKASVGAYLMGRNNWPGRRPGPSSLSAVY